MFQNTPVKGPSHTGVSVCSTTSHCLMIELLWSPSPSCSSAAHPPSPRSLSLSHTRTRTHTHFLLTPAWPFTPLQINMCNSGEILHHHGNQASCPMESRAVNHAVWFPSPLLPSPLSYYDFAYFYLFVYFCVFVIVYFCCRGVLVISLLISGFLRTTTFHTSSF